MTQQGKAPRRNALFPIGINYYPLDAETQSWNDWYARDVEEDFKAFAEARMTLVRLYLSWKVLEPQVGQYDEDALERLQDIIDAARDNKLQVILCFFAEDRLSEMVDVPWGKRRDPHTDDYLIEREISLVQKVVNRFRSDTAVFGWDLANEAFCSGFDSSEDMLAWVTRMRDAVREVDTERPVIISADPETLFRHTGVDPRDALDLCEFAVSHPTSAYLAYRCRGAHELRAIHVPGRFPAQVGRSRPPGAHGRHRRVRAGALGGRRGRPHSARALLHAGQPRRGRDDAALP